MKPFKSLKLKPSTPDSLDLLGLGEVMLRLDPKDSRIRNARSFTVWEGGGEYNVARSIRKTFGKRSGFVTALVDNEIGHLVEDLMLQGGIDTSLVTWSKDDGLVRNGLNFTERGYGVRGPLGVSDRSHTAISRFDGNSKDWENVFRRQPVRWFHTGGVFAGLSSTTHQCALKALIAARQNHVPISYDLNYRPGIWQAWGGPQEVQRINTLLVHEVDGLFGSYEDYFYALGIPHPKTPLPSSHPDPLDLFKWTVDETLKKFPKLSLMAMTHRTIHSASCHDWQGFLWFENQIANSRHYENLAVFDRVGSGDSFVSGVIHGILDQQTPDQIVEVGAAHGALAMTTPGDNSMVSAQEIQRLVDGEVPRILR